MAVSIAFLGPRGTFGEQVARLYAPEAQHLPFPSHTAVIRAIQDGAVAEAVVAIENSLEGAVPDTLDGLLQAEDVAFKAELVLPIEHNLIAAPGKRLEDIEVVMSHPQALAQCRSFLEAKLPRARLDAALSTAAAVEEAVRTPGAAGIGTRRAAELAGGQILAAGVQDVAQNKTRFLVLAREDAIPTGDDKTSIALTVPHDLPGSLLGVLQELAARNLNMTRIESRPSREDLGIYIFLIDFQGHRTEEAAAAAIDAVRAKSSYFRLFGSYRRYVDKI